MTWGFVTCGPNEALVVSGNLNLFQVIVFCFFINILYTILVSTLLKYFNFLLIYLVYKLTYNKSYYSLHITILDFYENYWGY